MADYRRWYVPGGTYFFTVVTLYRMPLFRHDDARLLLGNAMRSVREELAYKTVACVLLHDHLHCIWTLPEGDDDYSTRWKRIKSEFTREWLGRGGEESPVSPAKRARGRRGVWQPRFWEHTIEDEEDLQSHFDYVHYNPLKHGYVKRLADWPWSSFHRYVAEGHYPPDWGSTEPPHLGGLEFE
jgi:REP-associated tyrosine transposase